MTCRLFAGALLFSVLLLQPLGAVTIFVDSGFDRSAWTASVSGVTTDTFTADIAQSDTLNFASGIQSIAVTPLGSPNHFVGSGRFSGTLRPAASVSTGYLTFTWTFPVAVTAFGADFFSIGGSRQVSVQGTFDGGLEAFDLRALFTGDGGLDQGFFGLTSTTPFSSITLIALGTSTNDAFTVDNAAFGTANATAVPEPSTLVLFGGAAALFLFGRRRRG